MGASVLMSLNMEGHIRDIQDVIYDHSDNVGNKSQVDALLGEDCFAQAAEDITRKERPLKKSVQEEKDIQECLNHLELVTEIASFCMRPLMLLSKRS